MHFQKLSLRWFQKLSPWKPNTKSFGHPRRKNEMLCQRSELKSCLCDLKPTKQNKRFPKTVAVEVVLMLSPNLTKHSGMWASVFEEVGVKNIRVVDGRLLT